MSRLEEDLEKISRMGFNTVYFFDIHRDPEYGATQAPLWYPKEAPYDMTPPSLDKGVREGIEEAFEGIFKVALQKDLRVILSICYNVPLQWLWSNLDAAKRRADGSLHHTVYYHECFRSEKIRQYTRDRLRQLLERYAENEYFIKAMARFRIVGNDAILDEDGSPLFVIHNDTVDRGFCYCGSCVKAWQEEFLPRLYGDIDAFNAIHEAGYGSFDEVPLPQSRDDERLWHDFSTFFTEGLMGWMEVIRSTIRGYMPDALLSIIMKYPRFGPVAEYPDWTRVSELCDVLFMDPYPMEHGTEWNIKGYAYDFETYRSLSLMTGKPMLLQFQLAPSYAGVDMKPVRAPNRKEILQQFYVAIGRGGRGMVCWGFPPGISKDDHPDVMMDEEEAIETAAQINAEARRLFRASDGTKEVYGQIMLPYNRSSLIMGEENLTELFELYKYISRLGLTANPTFADFMLDMESRGHRYDALVGFSSLKNVCEDRAKGLTAWLKLGGLLLCGADSFLKDEKGTQALGLFNENIVGSHATGEPAEGDLRILEDRPYLPAKGTYPKPDSVATIATTRGKPDAIWAGSDTGAVVANDVGQGFAERIGIKGIPRFEDATTSNLLEAFLKHIPNWPIRVACPNMDGVDFTFRSGSDLVIIYLVNNDRQGKRMGIRMRPSALGMPREGYIISDTLSQKEIMRVRMAETGEEIGFHVALPSLGSRAITVMNA